LPPNPAEITDNPPVYSWWKLIVGNANEYIYVLRTGTGDPITPPPTPPDP
jgi:hypothetical protein